jgi:hypothetical protein
MRVDGISDGDSALYLADATVAETTGLLSNTPTASGGDTQSTTDPSDTTKKKKIPEAGQSQTSTEPGVARSVLLPVRQVDIWAPMQSRANLKVGRAACRFCQYTALITCIMLLVYWMDASSDWGRSSGVSASSGWSVDDDGNLLPGSDDNSTHVPTQLPTPHPTPTAPPSDDEIEALLIFKR